MEIFLKFKKKDSKLERFVEYALRDALIALIIATCIEWRILIKKLVV
jgi:hypothetical protein